MSRRFLATPRLVLPLLAIVAAAPMPASETAIRFAERFDQSTVPASVPASSTFAHGWRFDAFTGFTPRHSGAFSMTEDANGIATGRALEVSAHFNEFVLVAPGEVPLGPSAGDRVVLSFDLRFVEPGGPDSSGLRFMLAGSAGTPLVGGFSEGDSATDDAGYWVALGVGAPGARIAAKHLHRELRSFTSGKLGEKMRPEEKLNPATSEGVADLPIGTSFSLQGESPWRFRLELTRDADGGVVVALFCDDVRLGQTRAAVPVIERFDQVAFGTGSAGRRAFVLDNVVLAAEPATKGR